MIFQINIDKKEVSASIMEFHNNDNNNKKKYT